MSDDSNETTNTDTAILGRDDERPAAEALAAASFHRESERRWSMQDYLADSASIDRVEASEHFFATFGRLALVQRDISRLLAAARTLAAGSGVIYLETSTAHTADARAREALAGSIRWNDDLAALRSAILADPAIRGPTRRDCPCVVPGTGAFGSAPGMRQRSP